MRAVSRSAGNRLLFVALLIAPIVVASLPISLLERAPSVCLIQRAGLDCWGCGITRAVVSAARGEFDRAWDYNPRVIVVAPLLLIGWARTLRAAHQRLRKD